MGRFKIGICEWAVTQRGKDLCSMTKKLGLDGIQLGIGPEAAEGKGLYDKRIVQEYLRGRAEHNIELTSISVTALDHFSMCKPDSEEEHQKAIGFIRKAIDLAHTMEIGMVMCPSFNRSAVTNESSFEQTVENYKWLCAYAETKGVMLSTESNMKAKDIISLVEQVGQGRLKVYFDSQNHYLKDRTYIPDLYNRLMPYLCNEIHVKDGIGDSLSGALLGEGSTDFFKTAKAIVESEFHGYIVLENYYHRPPLSEKGDAETLITKDISTLKRVVGSSLQ